MRVRRTLPQRHRSLIGAWCFVDHYGPDDVDATGGMVLPAHPHTGLQTASWLFGGELEHRDSVGSLATVTRLTPERPGGPATRLRAFTRAGTVAVDDRRRGARSA